MSKTLAIGVSDVDYQYISGIQGKNGFSSKMTALRLMIAFCRENEFALQEYFKRLNQPVKP